MASGHKAYVKDFKPKEHIVMLGGIALLVFILIVSGIIKLIANHSYKVAKENFSVVENQIDNQNTSQKQTEIRKIPIHNSGAIDCTLVVPSSTDGIYSNDDPTLNFKLDCLPGDSITSPEYHALRMASDKAFIADWIRPALTYSSLDDYFANYDVMQRKFDDAIAVYSGMSDSKLQFFSYVMPDASDLKYTVSDGDKSKYNGSYTVGTVYLLDADVNNAPYDYSYLVQVSFTSTNRATGSVGNSAGSEDPNATNVVIICTVSRDDYGTPYFKDIRFSSLSRHTVTAE